MENNTQPSPVVTPGMLLPEEGITELRSKLKSTAGLKRRVHTHAHTHALARTHAHARARLFVQKGCHGDETATERHRGATEMAIINLKH